jgi:hypothetical protein
LAFSGDPGSKRAIVAAGFGFQNADSSTITVKTYDALTGEILSNESYDLNVKDDGASSAHQPSERIFAGGVGLGADGLSDFTLRVYDAADGKFLWEGKLNLAGDPEASAARRVAAELQPTALGKTVGLLRKNGQPSFFIRATDLVTGRLVWADQFSAGHGMLPRIERIRARLANGAEIPSTVSKNFDFRIRMFDEQGGQLLWEDTIVPSEDDESLSRGSQEETDMVPAWSRAQQHMRKDAVRSEVPPSAEAMLVGI